MIMRDDENKELMEFHEKYYLIKLKQLALPLKTKYETSEELDIMELARKLEVEIRRYLLDIENVDIRSQLDNIQYGCSILKNDPRSIDPGLSY